MRNHMTEASASQQEYDEADRPHLHRTLTAESMDVKQIEQQRDRYDISNTANETVDHAADDLQQSSVGLNKSHQQQSKQSQKQHRGNQPRRELPLFLHRRLGILYGFTACRLSPGTLAGSGLLGLRLPLFLCHNFLPLKQQSDT